MRLSESSHFTFVYDDPEYSLVVLNARPEHSGVYTCTAKNLAASNSCKAEVTVHTGLTATHTEVHTVRLELHNKRKVNMTNI